MNKIIVPIAALVLLAVPLTAGSALAAHDRPQTAHSNLYDAARQVEHEARTLHHRAAQRARRGDRRVAQILPAFHTLHERAERFRQKLGRNVNDPKRLRRQYDRLHHAFEYAEACLRDLGIRGHGIRKDMRRVERLVYRLDSRIDAVVVARRERRHDRYEGRDRYGWRSERGRHSVYRGLASWIFELR